MHVVKLAQFRESPINIFRQIPMQMSLRQRRMRHTYDKKAASLRAYLR